MAVVVFTGVMIMTGCDGGNEDPSDPTSVPNAPTFEDIYVENRLISVLWYVVEGADSYNLYWNTTGNVTTSDNSYTDLQTPYNFISFEHSGLSFFKTYYYRLTAVNSLGESSLSSEISASPAVTIEELWKRAASDYEDGDELGRSVSISGDYLIAGAPNEDDLGLDRGAVYIYSRDYGATDAWAVIGKRIASDAADSDSFGHSVSISGDYFVVGAPNKDGLGADEGAAYVFYRNQGADDAWGEAVILTASDAAAGDSFGHSVSISGDYVVVGANRKGGGGTDRGAAYVFNRNYPNPDDWGEVAKLTASDTADGDRFGSSVSISGDYVTIGAPYKDDIGVDEGAVYVYDRNLGGTDAWGQVLTLTASDAAAGDEFGFSVAIDGDYVVVSAPNKDGTGTDEGAAYVFDRNQGGTDAWGEVLTLTASDAEDSDYFGSSVSIAGDYILVGAPDEDGTGTDQGAAYVYYRNQDGPDAWGEVMKLVSGGAQDDDFLGYSVAISDHFAITGVPGEDGVGTDIGAVSIF